jgi:hypothetical protein
MKALYSFLPIITATNGFYLKDTKTDYLFHLILNQQ